MNGLGDYVLLGQSCDYPPIVGQWSAISDQQIETFTPPDFCRGDCFAGLGDLSQIQMTAPGGYFASSDITQWGAAEWLTLAGGVYFLVSLTRDVKRVSGRVSKRAGKIKRGFTS